MKRALTFTVFATLLLLLILIFPISNVQAQGTWTCQVSGSSCGVSGSCDSDFEPPVTAYTVCGDFNYDECVFAQNNLSFDCISSEWTEGTIVVQNGPNIENCGIRTAIGCIPIQDENRLALFFLQWGMGLGGGIALIVMVIATFMIMSSAGDPGKLQAGKELLTSAITGLVMLVLSAWLLNFIGVDLLQLF